MESCLAPKYSIERVNSSVYFDIEYLRTARERQHRHADTCFYSQMK
jgi:hypothetical protein